MTTPNTSETSGFSTFVDDMSGGAPPIGLDALSADYAIVGWPTALIPMDTARFTTAVEPHPAHVTGAVSLVRTVSVFRAGDRLFELFEDQEGYGRRRFRPERVERANLEDAADEVVTHVFEILVAMKDFLRQGRLQSLDADD